MEPEALLDGSKKQKIIYIYHLKQNKYKQTQKFRLF